MLSNFSCICYLYILFEKNVYSDPKSEFKNFFIEVQLLYSIVLASAVQQNEAVIHIHKSPLF